MVEWWRRPLSAFTWAAKMTYAVLISVPYLRSRFFRAAAALSCAIRTAPLVPKDPTNPLRGSYTIPVPVEQIVFPGGDASLVTNLEYRITIAGPVALAPFVDVGMNPIVRGSQLRINPGQLANINTTVFGCPALDIALNCTGGHTTDSSVLPEICRS